jgi:hypothetical protein
MESSKWKMELAFQDLKKELSLGNAEKYRYNLDII